MHRFVIAVFLLVAGGAGYAQGGNYLYIDSENNQAFYIKMEGQVYSSSQTGYLIFPGLKQRDYQLIVGFPKDIYPEQRFDIAMNGNDQGFHLKKEADAGWTLLNLKTGETVRNSNPEKKGEDTGVVRKTDPFSVLLARVVNDPAVLIATPPAAEKPAGKDITKGRPATDMPADRPEPAKEPEDTTFAGVPSDPRPPEPETAIREEETKPAMAKDSVSQPLTVTTPATQEPIQIDRPQPVKNPAGVLKLFDQRFEKVYEAVYIDESEGQRDTIRISYPINQDTTPQPAAAGSAGAVGIPEKAEADTVAKDQKADPGRQKPEADSAKGAMVTGPEREADSGRQRAEADSAKGADVAGAAKEKPSGVVLVNTDCKNFADEQDVDKLRVKILDERTADGKINTARKYFRTKCFTVRQVRALSELFAGDENKYRFFDTAYPFISDFENFPGLEEQLNEPYYKNRFKALIRK